MVANGSADIDIENMDKFFESIFGTKPSKRGKGFEMLVGAVLKIVDPSSNVSVDQYLRGTESGSTYQVDTLLADAPGTAIEAKDYVERNKPVGRADLQKLAGALQDLALGRGMVASATGFTKPSKRYSDATQSAATMKPIDLAHVRPSVERDQHGRFRRIILEFQFFTAAPDRAVWKPRFAPEALELLRARGCTQLRLPIDALLDGQGNVRQTIRDFLAELEQAAGMVEIYKTERVFNEPTFVRYEDTLVRLHSISVELPFDVVPEQIIIESIGTPKVLLQCENGKVDTLISEEQLRLVRFEPDGSVSLTGDPLDVKVRRSSSS